jgi:succinate dehydrogenase / fumarate reductase, cytochrome b subunit
MATTGEPGRIAQITRIWQGPIGKKAIMAITGVILFGFVLAHMAGNLQVFLGAEKINAYGRFLHSMSGLLWTARIILLVSVLLHIWAAVSLTMLSKAARPVAYRKRGNLVSSYASRTMVWSGLIIAAFVVYHLMHFTFGNAHPSFIYLDVYHNMVTGFQQVPVSIAYIVAMLLLGSHLYHGVYSMFQSLGLTHPGYTPRIKMAAGLFALLVTAGNISMPVAVMAGVIK